MIAFFSGYLSGGQTSNGPGETLAAICFAEGALCCTVTSGARLNALSVSADSDALLNILGTPRPLGAEQLS